MLKNNAAIIQARIGSTRFRGKVLKNILGKPSLIHSIDRIKKMKNIDNIIIVTTTGEEDNIIIETIENYDNNIGLYRGKKEDVLDRYYRAALEFDIDVIVRITSDNPLIDPRVSDTVVNTYLKNDCDYCCNNMPKTYPIGLDTEVMSFDALKAAWKKANKSFEREHVTPYIRKHKNEFKIINVKNNEDLSQLRWTMDYVEDFEFINAIYEHLYNKSKIFYMEDILQLLQKNPQLKEINKKYS